MNKSRLETKAIEHLTNLVSIVREFYSNLELHDPDLIMVTDLEDKLDEAEFFLEEASRMF